ncbi:hypothetical protein [Streptomyces caatingaensis]|uniref:Uncharacterized protein n=1 Tax=Streptomyces caatingaensis TaxID=1678637 RepID=A0A0K9XCH2_9ACTN|nr:hypothetical protein [Streptomyces caatingaensis]KNB51104.1 hypothetical protein AC230_18345 [Streptomyces caatingaensis]
MTTTSKPNRPTRPAPRKTANPRRTTLAHRADSTGLFDAERPEHPVELPSVTANPRRTTLMVAPAAPDQD